MADTTPKTDDSKAPAIPLSKPKRSPFVKKVLSELGSAIDLGGRGIVAVAFAAQFIKPQTLPYPGAGVLLGLGVLFVFFGIYLKAEAER
ncbi:hypothetical protein LJR225_005158 [Phenylobacterium sp. LjRoot225]|uniref:hypothetical protein n=1 Tax=Phenylobacterium sp. LjRoot225 TaxID=3342285 RepID=UPI003ECE37D2